MPSTAPATSQSRSSALRTARTTSQVTAVQARRSNVEVLSQWPVTSTIDATAAQDAATACARREPPSSRASRPVSSTVAAAASADGRRRTVSEPGASSLIARAMRGVSGPWSA